MSDAIKHHGWYFFFQEDSALVHMHCGFNTVQLLRHSRLHFAWTMPPTATSWTHWLHDLGSHTNDLWVKKTEEIKERLVQLWQYTDTELEWKMRFSCFHVLPGSAEAQVTWGGTVNKAFLWLLFLPKISKCVHVCQSYNIPKVRRFLRQCIYNTHKHSINNNMKKEKWRRKLVTKHGIRGSTPKAKTLSKLTIRLHKITQAYKIS